MKKITRSAMIITSLLIASSSFAQFPVTWSAQFQHTSSNGYSNEGRRIAEDAAGNIFMLADATSDIDPSGVLGTITYHYTSIVKYSTTGMVLGKMNIDVKDHVVSGYNNN